MFDMKADIYETIINIKGSYANFPEALADELYQNIFDNTLAHVMFKNGELNKESDGPPAGIEISFDDGYKAIQILQKGTTGIIRRDAYIELAKKTKGRSDRGSRGQGWKIWLTCVELVFTETIVRENDIDTYYANIMYPNHKEKKIRVSSWSNDFEKVFEDLESDGIEITPYKLKIKKKIDDIGTRILFYNMEEKLYNTLKKNYFKSVLINKWYPLLVKCLNYKVFIQIQNNEEV